MMQKIYKSIVTDDDTNSLQRVVSRITEWCNTWLLKLNINKCKVVSYSRKQIIDSNYYITEENIDYILEKVDSIKDLGVIFDSRLNFRNHMQNKINKAYSMIGIIKRNFINMDMHTFALLYKSSVRTVHTLNMLCQYGAPIKKETLKRLKKIQKRTTKLIISLKKSYHTKNDFLN